MGEASIDSPTICTFAVLMERTKIAIVCQHDTLWSLYAWNKALPLLKADSNYEISGFWVCDEKFMNVPREKVMAWYLNTFGLLNFIKLACFKVAFSLVAFIKSITSGYRSLCL